MSNYTEQEVQDAVEKIVRSSVRHPTGILGDRNISVSFSDIQEAAAGVFILYANAPFYALRLGVMRLLDAVQSQASTVETLIDAIAATDRLVAPIADISPLANARSALEELESAVSSREDGFADITKVPAFRRYVQNLDGFIGAVGPSIKNASAGTGAGSSVAIVDTPSGARAKIPSLVRQLVSAHEELVRRVRLLAGAIDDFSALNLPRIAAQGVISRARAVLDGHYTELSALDENTRLDSMRSVLLDLLTQKPLVQKYGAATGPSEFIFTEGAAAAFADARFPGEPAARVSDKAGPYPILDAHQFIRFTMNGGSSFDYPLPLAFVAEMQGTLQEPFTIGPTNDELRIVFGDLDTSTPTYNISLTNGSRTAEQVAAEVNAVMGPTGLVMEEMFYPLRYKSPVNVTSLGGNNARFTVIVGDLLALGVTVGDEVDVLSGPDAGTTWTVTTVDLGGQFVDASGSAPITPGLLIDVEMGPAARALRLRDTDEAYSVAIRRTIRLPQDSPMPLTAATLGFFPGASARSRPVAAKDLADNINQSTSQLRAEAVFEATEYSGRARSEPTDPTRVVFSRWQNGGTMTAGTVVTIHTGGMIPSGVGLNDCVVLRSTLVPAELNLEGYISDIIAHDILEVTFPTAVTAGLVDIEVGPPVSFGFGSIVVINDGPNAGRYVVGEQQGVRTTASFEAVLEGALPVPKDGDLPVTFNASLGVEYVQFSSRDTTLASKVVLDNAGASQGAAYFIAGALPDETIGATPYLRFNTFPSGMVVGDLVLFYITQYNVPDETRSIVSIDTASHVLELDSALDNDFTIPFDFDVPNPFGRIRVAQVANYTELKERLNAWLNQPEQQALYFRDLARFLNPIVTNANPTVSMVNDATNHLKKLLAVLAMNGAELFGTVHVPSVGEDGTLEFALDAYEAPTVEPVDVLLSTFRQKGADRAIDLLLEGQFTAFFNLGIDNVSYSGTLMKGLRDLAREDLPVRKFARRDTAGSKLIGSTPEATDFEFSSEDADSPNAPDIPMSPDVASPGENY